MSGQPSETHPYFWQHLTSTIKLLYRFDYCVYDYSQLALATTGWSSHIMRLVPFWFDTALRLFKPLSRMFRLATRNLFWLCSFESDDWQQTEQQVYRCFSSIVMLFVSHANHVTLRCRYNKPIHTEVALNCNRKWPKPVAWVDSYLVVL